ncbi:hypothetical protein Poli38472_002154 [Pythium oligandrum]|uniref:protein O-GlcNAc transferase n=1 Tax=Pythium oligandrum TaxID=41045 RepID=A0A8K1CHS2_PYTOL|nr:hypothetical protein Poli38472_002154 [Pythium oligandrum]|eukprot:TMW63213.1 hypothetical protein Poli38472_002154 [Pythium oligandrum]
MRMGAMHAIILLLLACCTSCAMGFSFPYFSESVVEILFPPNNLLAEHSFLEIQIAMRPELLDPQADDTRVCVGMATVYAPPDLDLEAGKSGLHERCYEQFGNYTTFQLSGLVPGVRYAITIGLMNGGRFVAHSMRTLEVASIVARRQGRDTTVHRMGVGEAIGIAMDSMAHGDRKFAREIYKRVLDMFPNHVEALHGMGAVYYHEGDLVKALEYVQRAFKGNESDPRIHLTMGLCLRGLGRVEEALRVLQTAVSLKPDYFDAWGALGDTYRTEQQWDDSLAAYRAVTSRLDEAKTSGMVAEQSYERLCELLRFTEGWYDAEQCLSTALSHWPENSNLHELRGHLMLQAGQFEVALQEYEASARLESINGKIAVAEVLEALGEYRASIRQYDQIIERLQEEDDTPTSLVSRVSIMKIMVLPRILPSTNEEIDQMRAIFDEYLDRVLQRLEEPLAPIELDPSRIAFSTAVTLNAHNRNNRLLKHKLGRVYHLIMIEQQSILEQFSFGFSISPPPFYQTYNTPKQYPYRRLRVGVVSRFIYNTAVGLYMKELLQQLDLTKYELVVFAVGQSKSLRQSGRIEHIGDRVTLLPRDLGVARSEVRKEELDVLIYPELGMDKTTYFLSFERLAPIQAAWWGNPDTTGVPAIDYYLVSEYEHENAREHYTEELFRMKGMGIYHTLPPLPQRNTTREDIRKVMQERFNLPVDFHFYLSIESMLHLHPDFDGAVLEILERDPLAYVFLLAPSARKRWKQMLLKRLQQRVGNVNAGRIAFFTDVDSKQEIKLLMAADTVLGSIHMTRPRSAMQAFTAGVPVVTLVGELWSSRIAYAFYQQMRIRDLIATSITEYVELALRLAEDERFRKRMTRKIQRRRRFLSADPTAVTEWERFLDFASTKLFPLECRIGDEMAEADAGDTCPMPS